MAIRAELYSMRRFPKDLSVVDLRRTTRAFLSLPQDSAIEDEQKRAEQCKLGKAIVSDWVAKQWCANIVEEDQSVRGLFQAMYTISVYKVTMSVSKYKQLSKRKDETFPRQFGGEVELTYMIIVGGNDSSLAIHQGISQLKKKIKAAKPADKQYRAEKKKYDQLKPKKRSGEQEPQEPLFQAIAEVDGGARVVVYEMKAKGVVRSGIDAETPEEEREEDVGSLRTIASRDIHLLGHFLDRLHVVVKKRKLHKSNFRGYVADVAQVDKSSPSYVTHQDNIPEAVTLDGQTRLSPGVVFLLRDTYVTSLSGRFRTQRRVNNAAATRDLSLINQLTVTSRMMDFLGLHHLRAERYGASELLWVKDDGPSLLSNIGIRGQFHHHTESSAPVSVQGMGDKKRLDPKAVFSMFKINWPLWAKTPAGDSNEEGETSAAQETRPELAAPAPAPAVAA